MSRNSSLFGYCLSRVSRELISSQKFHVFMNSHTLDKCPRALSINYEWVVIYWIRKIAQVFGSLYTASLKTVCYQFLFCMTAIILCCTFDIIFECSMNYVLLSGFLRDAFVSGDVSVDGFGNI